MSDWDAKRFWTDADVGREDGGFTVLLDGKPVRTPAKAPLIVPSEHMARAVAAEWQAQDDKIRPDTMPFTRSANSAIDRVRIQFDDVVEIVADHGDSDLLCYRAETPQGLVERQNAAWDPLLMWSADVLGARLEPRVGVIHMPQAPADLAKLRHRVETFDPFQLTAFHDLVSLSGSLVIGFAVCLRLETAANLWDVSRIDELWQREQWGADEEADHHAKIKQAAFLHADDFFRSCKPDS